MILVGHSMGGVVITRVAARCPERIAKLVYVAAFLPADGQCLADLAQLPEGAGDMVQENVAVEGDPPVATMPAEAAREAFYALCSPEQVAWATERLRPQPLVAVRDAGRDRRHGGAAPAARVRHRGAGPRAARRAPARPVADNSDLEVAELDADHSPFLSRPRELAAALDRFAGPE